LGNEEVAWEVGMSEKYGPDPGKWLKEDCEAREAARKVECQSNLPACNKIPLLLLPSVPCHTRNKCQRLIIPDFYCSSVIRILLTRNAYEYAQNTMIYSLVVP
jgi:hypothetical protein